MNKKSAKNAQLAWLSRLFCVLVLPVQQAQNLCDLVGLIIYF